MNRTTLERFPAVLVLGLVLGLGCAPQGGADRPATCPVTGTVTHNGQVVEGATVNFQLVDGARSAVGLTDVGGKYSLMTFEPGDGAVAGEYKVKIVKYEGAAATGASPDEIGDDYVPPEEATGEQEPSGPRNLLPAKYADADSSGLTATVAEGDNSFDFKLED